MYNSLNNVETVFIPTITTKVSVQLNRVYVLPRLSALSEISYA